MTSLRGWLSAAFESLPYSVNGNAVRLAIRLTPGAQKDSVEGSTGDADGKNWLRVRITAPPVDGKANQALIKFLSKRWRIPKSALEIAGGATSRNKILTIRGDVETIAASIKADL